MARINQDLLDAIIAKTGSKRTAYRRIQQVQTGTFLERDLAALVVGAQLRISINRYSTAAQRGAIRGHIGGAGGNAPASSPPAAPSAPAPRGRNSNAAKPRKKDNTVFVISGRDGLLICGKRKPQEMRYASRSAIWTPVVRSL